MNIFEYIIYAMKSLLANKGRTVLTMLGIIIGISSVIVVTSIGNGSKESISGDLKSMGSNTITVEMNNYGEESITKRDLFTDRDKEILSSHKDILSVSPGFEGDAKLKISKTGKEQYITISGADKELFDVFNLKFLYGRVFTEKENSEKENFIIIDSMASKKIFNIINSVGKTLDIKIGSRRETFLIIGVFKNPFEKVMQLTGETEGIYSGIIPRKTAYKVYRKEEITNFTIKVKDKNKMPIVVKDIKKILEKQHNNKNKYIVRNESKEIESFDKILNLITIFISFVASISLFVGGIGVMNIMLVSVTERTREIGIRKALGAEDWDILLQFLLEAVIIAILGGIIGILSGYSLAVLIGLKLKIKAILSLKIIFVALSVSSVTGIVFGVLPAKKASDLKPIDALRYE